MNTNSPSTEPSSSIDHPAQDGIALFTDLYELTMLQAYFEEEMMDEAVFSLSVRNLPARRNFLLACGLDTVLAYLEGLSFSEEDLAYLSSLGQFSNRFLSWLGDFRFSGEVRAVAEGTPLFANEPILEVIAPLPQAQLAETFILNQVHLQTVLASKAQRVVSAAQGRPVIDFGSRRIHGIDAALKAVRAFYIGGVAATSNVLAGKLYGVSIAGTMAHSYIQTHEDEAAAFSAYARLFPRTVLLVDTYDTIAGIGKITELAKKMGEDFKVRAVRLDSGDLLALSREVRKALDGAGLTQVEIFASGGLDEDAIARLMASGAPIDGFGVGTAMGVSTDAPVLDMGYKLCEYGGKGRVKLSRDKPVLPGRKQVFRVERNGQYVGDTIARDDENLPGQPLLIIVMQNGKRLPAGTVELEAARRHAQRQIARLPERIRQLAIAEQPYPVETSAALTAFQREVEREVTS